MFLFFVSPYLLFVLSGHRFGNESACYTLYIYHRLPLFTYIRPYTYIYIYTYGHVPLYSNA